MQASDSSFVKLWINELNFPNSSIYLKKFKIEPTANILMQCYIGMVQ